MEVVESSDESDSDSDEKGVVSMILQLSVEFYKYYLSFLGFLEGRVA